MKRAELDNAARILGIEDTMVLGPFVEHVEADARREPLEVLRGFADWCGEESDNHSDGELCFVCDQVRCAPTCLRVRALTLLADAPEPGAAGGGTGVKA